MGLKASVLPDDVLGECAEKNGKFAITLLGQDRGSGFLINEKQCRAIKALLIKINEGAEEVQISG